MLHLRYNAVVRHGRSFTLDLLLLFGTAALLGLAGGKLITWLRIPRVVGFIAVGVVLGGSFTNLIPLDLIATLSPLTDFALALIGFMIGGELKGSVFRRFGWQMVTIMLVEGLAAFVLVSTLITLVTGQLALGLLLGALSSATAPAATVDVLWEYKSRGPLTTTILGIVALDDGLALILFGFAWAFARARLEGQPLSATTAFLDPAAHILGALALGVVIGLAVIAVLRKLPRNRDDELVLLIGMVLLVAGLAHHVGVSLILAEMALGVTLANVGADGSRRAFELMKGITPPIYILFFVLVGARLQIALLPQIGLIGLLYVGGRTLGKFAGSWAGGGLVRAPAAVRNYLGFALFSQAGVAIGLALAIAQELHNGGPAAQAVGTQVVTVIAATTFVVQLIGPPFEKFAVSRAGEIPPAQSGAVPESPEEGVADDGNA
ncbi:MAG: cation:proton antiporter [Planctomycetota bacterium]